MSENNQTPNIQKVVSIITRPTFDANHNPGNRFVAELYVEEKLIHTSSDFDTESGAFVSCVRYIDRYNSSNDSSLIIDAYHDEVIHNNDNKARKHKDLVNTINNEFIISDSSIGELSTMGLDSEQKKFLNEQLNLIKSTYEALPILAKRIFLKQVNEGNPDFLLDSIKTELVYYKPVLEEEG